jgi:PKD repeat protein
MVIVPRRISLSIAMALIIASVPLLAMPALAVDSLPVLWQGGGLSAGTDSAGQAARMTADPAGNVAVVSGPSDGRDLAVTSYTSTGSLRWSSAVSPSIGTFQGDWIVAAPNGDFIAVGHNVSGSSGNPIAITLVRYGSNGTLLWRVDLARTLPNVARLLVDSSGNAYLAFNSVGDGQDIQIHKYSPLGILLWSKVISTGSFANDVATSLALSPTETDVVVTGDIVGGASWITALYDTSTGTRKWLVTAPEGTAALDVVIDASRVYVTGQGNVGITGYLSVIAYDRASGARLWRTDKKPADGASAAGLRTALAPDGSLVATGQALRGFLDWYTVALETTGAVRWESVRDGGLNTDEVPAALLVLPDGTTVVSGKGGPNLPGGFIPGVTVGYSTTGTLLWEAFSPLATVWATALPGGDVCATGGYDAYVACFRPSVGTGGNLLPVAAISATPSSGAAPLTVSFDATTSSDPDGTVVSWAWTFGDGATANGSQVQHVYSTAGTYSVAVTVTDDAGGIDIETVVVTVSGSGSIHVADLDGSAVSTGRTWTATVTVTIRNGAGSLVAGAIVSGTWTGAPVSTCTTDASGKCSLMRASTGKTQLFTVVGVTHSSLTYDPAANADPDGDSDGMAITINKPPRVRT